MPHERQLASGGCLGRLRVMVRRGIVMRLPR